MNVQTRIRLSVCLMCLVLYVIFYKHSIPIVNRVANSFRYQNSGLASKQLSIPRIIHQIWNNKTVPRAMVENVKGVVRHQPFPRWQYYFWTKESGIRFIKDKYPFLYDRIIDPKATNDLLRADILRYLVVHEYGGVYFDLDTVSVKPLDDFVHTHECSLVLEPGEHYFQWRVDILITNGALFCIPRHPFYKLIIDHIYQMDLKCKTACICTGPSLITNLYKRANATDGIIAKLPDLLPSKWFQDAYYVKISTRILRKNCLDQTKYKGLKQFQKKICDSWKERGREGGREKRNLSEQALSYHTWYHIRPHRVTYLADNEISKIVPHVRIYGENL